MVLRFLIRLLANNELLVQKLSESYPVRKAAQLVVRMMNTSKDFAQQHGLDRKLTPEEFRNLMRAFASKLQNQIRQTQEEIKRKK